MGRLGNVHAMSHPVSAYFNVPHGVANSILLPNVVEYNALADHGRYEVIYNYIREGSGSTENFTPELLVEELRRLTDAGYKEVVLTAISLPSYGTDSGTSLVELIEKAAEVPGIERIRLGSLDPDMLHDDDIRRMAP